MIRILSAALVLMFASSFAHAGEFQCTGTEPFFGVTINTQTNRLKIVDPSNAWSATLTVAGPYDAWGMMDGTVFVYKTKYTSATLVADVIAGTCSDGMSDEEYAYHLIYNNGETVLYGCCNYKQ